MAAYKVYVGWSHDRCVTLLIDADEINDGNDPADYLRPGVERLEFRGNVDIDGPGLNCLTTSLTDGE